MKSIRSRSISFHRCKRRRRVSQHDAHNEKFATRFARIVVGCFEVHDGMRIYRPSTAGGRRNGMIQYRLLSKQYPIKMSSRCQTAQIHADLCTIIHLISICIFRIKYISRNFRNFSRVLKYDTACARYIHTVIILLKINVKMYIG